MDEVLTRRKFHTPEIRSAGHAELPGTTGFFPERRAGSVIKHACLICEHHRNTVVDRIGQVGPP